MPVRHNQKGHQEAMTGILTTSSHRRILHRRRLGNQRRSKSSPKLSDRMRMSAGGYRGCRNWVPENDGREHKTRRTTPASSSSFRSWPDRLPRSRVSFISSIEHPKDHPLLVPYNTLLFPICRRDDGLYFSTWGVFSLVSCLHSWKVYV